MSKQVIRTAYSYSPKFRSYQARAYVLDTVQIKGEARPRTFKHTACTGIGDSAQEAIAEAVRHLQDIYQRESLPLPAETESAGRIRADFLTACLF